MDAREYTPVGVDSLNAGSLGACALGIHPEALQALWRNREIKIVECASSSRPCGGGQAYENECRPALPDIAKLTPNREKMVCCAGSLFVEAKGEWVEKKSSSTCV